jgi:hypothetical protein
MTRFMAMINSPVLSLNKYFIKKSSKPIPKTKEEDLYAMFIDTPVHNIIPENATIPRMMSKITNIVIAGYIGFKIDVVALARGIGDCNMIGSMCSFKIGKSVNQKVRFEVYHSGTYRIKGLTDVNDIDHYEKFLVELLTIYKV